MRLARFAAALLLLAPLTVHAIEKVSNAEYRARRVALAGKLKGGAALLFAADEPAVDFSPYRQDEDFYYFTGWNEPSAALLVEAAVPADGTMPAEPYKEILFLPTRNLRLEKYTGAKIDANTPGAAELVGVDEVRPMTELVAELVRINKGDATHNFSSRIGKVYTQTDSTAAKSTLDLTAATLGESGWRRMRDIREISPSLRETKSPAELGLLKKAADASIAAHLATMKYVHPGVGENNVDGFFYAKLRDGHCERVAYVSIVGSGPNSVVLHHSSSDRVMQDGDLVVIDAAGEYSMYASDITRTLPVSGHFTPRQREIYNIVLGAQQAAAAAFVSGQFVIGGPGARGPNDPPSLDKVAYDYINSHGKDLHGQPLGQYFIHSVGHGVGENVHDPQEPGHKLGPGSVFTIEPGIYIPEENLGVRIEDVFWVDQDGKLHDFIANLPHTAEDVEAAMKQ